MSLPTPHPRTNPYPDPTPVNLSPPSLQWPLQFAHLASTLHPLISHIPSSRIEHVGSTSIPGLCAKPVLDVDIIVPTASIPAAVNALTTPSAGYIYKGEMGIPGRHALKYVGIIEKEMQGVGRNVYICEDGGLAVRNHLGVRDVLRGDEELRKDYARVKQDLVNSGVGVGLYTEGKSEVLGRILERAGIGREERDNIEKVNRA